MIEQFNTAPVITIAAGVHLPVVGFGTYLIRDDEATHAVTDAIDAGYRHVDTAEVYENEAGVGSAVNAALSRARPRRTLRHHQAVARQPGVGRSGEDDRDHDRIADESLDARPRLRRPLSHPRAR